MTPPHIYRATIFHVTANPWLQDDALVAVEDGGLLVEDGRIAACDEFATVRALAPAADVTDWRGGCLVPGFVDAHVHFPQLRIVGHAGLPLLDWLEQVALPEEASMADVSYAVDTAQRFVQALASHGTTTASVFGAHFRAATAALFEAADATGLRVVSGLVMSDRGLRSDLHVSPEQAWRDSTDLIRRFHQRGRLAYSVTPRFALSTSEAMLEVCQSLLREHSGLRSQTHINESRAEVEAVGRLFPWAADYLAVYERFGLTGRHAILAHNVHASPAELGRLHASNSSVAHCPSSNRALGSGILPMRRHLQAHVRVALGTDVGAGAGFSVMKEAMSAAATQRSAPEPIEITAAQMLYLSTLAGAEALNVDGETGNFAVGRSADFVHLRAPATGPFADTLGRASSLEDVLTAWFALAQPDSIGEVRVGGRIVFPSPVAH